jgi:hypothetical protein
MTRWDACELTGAAVMAGGLWMYAPWLGVTMSGAVLLVVGVAKCLKRGD